MNCRFCGNKLSHTLVDLGNSPLSNGYLNKETVSKPELYYPLRVQVCDNCWLVQAESFLPPSEIFNQDYAYFSGISETWLAHCKSYASNMISRFNLTANHFVVEIAANDGSLLGFFADYGINCLGVEPTSSTAAAAKQKGIVILEDFFGEDLAKAMKQKFSEADLIVANNVLAHVPDISDFVKGFSCLLNPNGVATFEFPHLLKLVKEVQFDTIYHEHFSYLSLHTVDRIFKHNGLEIFDVDQLNTHGGSLRVYAHRGNTGTHKKTDNVSRILALEKISGVEERLFYTDFQRKVDRIKYDLLSFLIEAKLKGKKVLGYGAAAKGNTLLNYAGVKPDLLPSVIDRNKAKQNKYLPGSHIPVVAEETLKMIKPDYVLILPWNIKAEIMKQLSYIRDWGGQFVLAVPKLELL